MAIMRKSVSLTIKLEERILLCYISVYPAYILKLHQCYNRLRNVLYYVEWNVKP